MQNKLKLLKEIKELWNAYEFEISKDLLKYLDEKDLVNLKLKILDSMKNLTPSQKEWLKKFKKTK